jgi:thymidylate synthase
MMNSASPPPLVPQAPPLSPSPLIFDTLGEVWINLVHETLQSGVDAIGEGPELLGVQVSFPASDQTDPLLTKYGDRKLMTEMEKVFFSDAPNSLGHSYARLMSGPAGRQDLQDIVELLRKKPSSKRALVAICGPGDGNVPCVNAVQFLCRQGQLQVIYFARGQDAYRKFYADGLCVAKMAQRVAGALGLSAGTVQGFIGSSHLYHHDRPAIDRFLREGRAFLKGMVNDE